MDWRIHFILPQHFFLVTCSFILRDCTDLVQLYSSKKNSHLLNMEFQEWLLVAMRVTHRSHAKLHSWTHMNVLTGVFFIETKSEKWATRNIFSSAGFFAAKIGFDTVSRISRGTCVVRSSSISQPKTFGVRHSGAPRVVMLQVGPYSHDQNILRGIIAPPTAWCEKQHVCPGVSVQDEIEETGLKVVKLSSFMKSGSQGQNVCDTMKWTKLRKYRKSVKTSSRSKSLVMETEVCILRYHFICKTVFVCVEDDATKSAGRL